MQSRPVGVIATGARTPLGFRSAAAAAAVRAGISRLGEHPSLIDQASEPMAAALDPELDAEMPGPARLLALATAALDEVCEVLSPRVNLQIPPLPIYLGVPEFRPGFTTHDAESLRMRLARLQGLPFGIKEVRVFPEGHAAGLSALATAVAGIQQGSLQVCLVGGVESYFQPETMRWLDANRQLAGTVSRSGFVPGEGAGFCLLMDEDCWTRLGLSPVAHVLSVAVGREANLIKTPAVCLGTGLTATVTRALADLRPPSETINDTICDVNGERYRGEEWGFVSLRVARYFDDPCRYVAAAGYWGDMGAASGPLSIMLACQAGLRGCARGPRSLVWASSEGGVRGAAVLGVGNPG